MAKSVFLTGGTGFVGRYLARLLLRSGYRVVCLTRNRHWHEPAAVDFVHGALTDSNACERVMQDCDTVLHLAGATGKQARSAYFQVNRDGTAALIQNAKRAGVKRFVFISTIAVKFPDISRYFYAQSKQQAETLVAESGLDWTIIRPTMIFGPGSATMAALNRLATLPYIPVFGNGRASLQPVFVEDLVQMIAAVAEGTGFTLRTVEIGGPEVISVQQLLERMRYAAGLGKSRIVHLPFKPIAFTLRMMEPILQPLLPVTEGQLISLVNDGTAAPDPLLSSWLPGMQTIDKMLQFRKTENGSA